METDAGCDALLGAVSNIYANPEIPTVIQTPMIIRQLFLGCFVDASDFEKVLTEQKVLQNSDGLNSEQPFIYINLVRDHELFIKSDLRFLNYACEHWYLNSLFIVIRSPTFVVELLRERGLETILPLLVDLLRLSAWLERELFSQGNCAKIQLCFLHFGILG